MPLGNVELVNASLQKYNKSTSAQIALGKVAIRDVGLTPDGWKLCDAAGANGPFVVAVNDLAAATDAYFTGAGAGTIVTMEAGAGIQPGAALKTDADGNVVTADLTGTAPDAESTIVGTYLTPDGTDTPAAASDGDHIRVRLGGASV